MQSFEQPAAPRRNPRSAPPPPAAPPKRSLLRVTLIGAMWVAVGAASAAYVATRPHDTGPDVAAADVADR